MTECEHGSFPRSCPVSGCINEQPQSAGGLDRGRRGHQQTIRTIVAAYDGRCMACAGPIREGDELVLADRRWVHQECANG